MTPPYHGVLNALKCRIASTRDVAVANFPPAEASFEEHVKRTLWQTKIWTSAHMCKPEGHLKVMDGQKRDSSWFLCCFMGIALQNNSRSSL